MEFYYVSDTMHMKLLFFIYLFILYVTYIYVIFACTWIYDLQHCVDNIWKQIRVCTELVKQNLLYAVCMYVCVYVKFNFFFFGHSGMKWWKREDYGMYMTKICDT